MDSWLLFPNPFTGSGSATNTIGGSTSPGTCPGGCGVALGDWYEGVFTFTSGKVSPTIVEDHWNDDSEASSTAFEREFFTPLYGYSRWEAWTVGATPESNCNGSPYLNVGGRTFVREFCYDVTVWKGSSGGQCILS